MGRRRELLLAASLTMVAVGVFASLGTWQVQRLHWKHRLIEIVTARTQAPAIPAPGRDDPLTKEGDALDYTRVTVEGRFLEGHDAHVQALLGEPHGPLGGPGAWILSPLRRADGAIVWINRGFVPVDRVGEATPVRANAEVHVEGIARRSEPRGSFTPDDEPAKNLWFVRDPTRLSAAFGLPVAATLPYTIDADASLTPPSGLPQAGETRLSFPDNHLGYALTWYGLAIAALGVFLARMLGGRRRSERTGPVVRRAR